MANGNNELDPVVRANISPPSAPEQAQESAVTDTNLGGAVTTGSQQRNRIVSQQVTQNIAAPQIPSQAIQTAQDIQVREGLETATPTDERFQIGQQDVPEAVQAVATAPVEAQQAQAAQMEAAQIGAGAAGTEQAATAQSLTPEATAAAAIGDLPQEAMVNSQMEDLLAGLESGDIPLWARPAVDAVESQLAARGISRSSVGQAALTNAIVSAALPMAQQNAQAITQNFEADKGRIQQVNLTNASAAQQLQFQSLNNEQQIAVLNQQQRQQAMLSDQAATNASRQFNAANQQQADQFMSSLQNTVDQQNAARLDAMEQFNTNATNAMNQFTSNLSFNRDQFNAQNATQIEQSNLQWRRQTNQINTAAQNAVNQANAMNAFNLSNQALTFMWQEMRDTAKWAFEAVQNDEQRKTAIATAAMGNEAAVDSNKAKYIAQLGAAAFNLF